MEQVGGDHRIEVDSLYRDAVPSEHEEIVFQVLADLPDPAGFGEDGLERRQGALQRDLRGRAQADVGERQVIGFRAA